MFENTIISHAKKYKYMQPLDFAKLCYQAEFGVAHFIDESCIDYLEKEYSSIVRDESFSRFDDIGNNFVRVHLQPLQIHQIPILADCFAKTGKYKNGTVEGLKERLSAVFSLLDSEEELFCFSKTDFLSFLRKYQACSYPAVHHSEEYKKNYHPSYRVIKREYLYLIYPTE